MLVANCCPAVWVRHNPRSPHQSRPSINATAVHNRPARAREEPESSDNQRHDAAQHDTAGHDAPDLTCRNGPRRHQATQCNSAISGLLISGFVVRVVEGSTIRSRPAPRSLGTGHLRRSEPPALACWTHRGLEPARRCTRQLRQAATARPPAPPLLPVRQSAAPLAPRPCTRVKIPPPPTPQPAA